MFAVINAVPHSISTIVSDLSGRISAAIAYGEMLFSRSSVPGSPALADAEGIVLDAASERKLIERVFQAARDDDEFTVARYLMEGFSPNVRNARGDTLLMVAVASGSRHVVGKLLDSTDIEVDAKNRMGLAPLASAALAGFDPIIVDLLAHGADPNNANSMGQTPIIFATLAGHTSTVELLITAGADPLAADKFGITPADLASTQGSAKTSAVLARFQPRLESARG